MLFHVHVNDAAHVHPLVAEHDVVALAGDLERCARRTPHATDGDGIAAERRIVLERIVGSDGFFAGRREELDHRLRTAGTAIGNRREQPRAEDVLTRRQCRGSPWSGRTIDGELPSVGELDRVEEAHVGAVSRQRSGYANLRADLQNLRRDAIPRQLRDAVRFADVLVRPAVLIDCIDVYVAVRILCLEFRDGAGDAHRLARVEVRREAVMRERTGCAEHDDEHDR